MATALAGCTYSLGNVKPQATRTADQQQLDELTCKDQARLADSDAAHAVGGFLLGLTIVGTPEAFAWDRRTQRAVYAQCMQAKGYTYIPPS